MEWDLDGGDVQRAVSLGTWAGQPVIGQVTGGGEITVWGVDSRRLQWRWKHPNCATPVALHLLTLYGRPTALIVGTDQVLRIVDTEAAQTTSEVHLGAPFQDLVQLGGDRVAVRTATGVMALWLGPQAPTGF
jgi:hypothetical protein